MMSMKMKELPISERPYEKLEMYGAHTLSNAELLAIIIKNGTKEESSVTLAQKVLSLSKKQNCIQDNLNFLQELSIEEFMKIKGIGKVKAIQLKAICELAKRISRPIENIRTKVKTPQDIVSLLMDELKMEKREIVKVIIMNSKNVILKIQTISQGGTNSVQVDTKDILMEAIKIGAPKIIMVHNHPSGEPTPSKEDIEFTQKLEKAAEILGIGLLDHIIIGYNQYTSIKSYLLEKELKRI
ncbi:MAG: DNA repair protein RadC [Clostridia bacterium]|nr:DNA repair protein RadC [Clostridia bacterium]